MRQQKCFSMRFKLSYKVCRAPSKSLMTSQCLVLTSVLTTKHWIMSCISSSGQATGLTANLDKCEFRKKIEFFGLIFSCEDISPDPMKVADLHRAAELKNASEVRSFFGLAQYRASRSMTLRPLPSPCERSRSRTMTGNGERKKPKPSTQLKQDLRSQRQPLTSM